MEDTQIVELFFSRSEEAISETSRKYGSYLRTIAHNVLPDSQDVEEVVNDVYLAAWNSIPPKVRECRCASVGTGGMYSGHRQGHG